MVPESSDEPVGVTGHYWVSFATVCLTAGSSAAIFKFVVVDIILQGISARAEKRLQIDNWELRMVMPVGQLIVLF